MKKVLIISIALLIIVLIALASFYIFNSKTIGPLNCLINYEKREYKEVTAECNTVDDCYALKEDMNCLPENLCSDEKTECINKKCMRVIVFDPNKTCV